MPRAGPLPLAPRPLPGEAMLSWVARLAARYDMSPADLLAELANDAALGIDRIARLDWYGDAELDRHLGASADIDVRCIQCGSRACRFQARRGRLRLECAACDSLVDQQSDRLPRHLPTAAGPLGVLPGARLDRAVAELQADLLAFLAPTRRRPEAAQLTEAVGDHLAVTVRELGAVVLEAAWMGACRPLRLRDRSGGFPAVGVEIAHDLLGLVAAVLLDAMGGPSTDVQRLRLGFPNIGVAPAGLATLIPELGGRELEELRARSPEWDPAVARAVRLAVETEVKHRRRVEEQAQAARGAARARGRSIGRWGKAKRRAS